MSKIGVYIGGRPSPFASRLAQRLQDEPEVEVVGGGDDGHQVVADVTRLRPEVVLLETDLGDRHVVDAVKSLSGACPDVSVIVVSADEDVDPLEAPLTPADPRPGSDADGDDIVSAVLHVLSGGSVDDPEVFTASAQDRVAQRIVRWDDSYHSNVGGPSAIGLKRYNVLISNRRACPGCYEGRVVRRGRSRPNPAYDCSGCGVKFVGATVVGRRVGIAERVSLASSH